MSVCWEQRSRLILASIDTSPLSAPPASTGFGSCGVAGVHSTRSQQRHSSTHSCRHASTTVTLFWRVRRPKVTTDKLQRVMNAAARVIIGTHKFDRGLSRLLHTELTGLMCPSECNVQALRHGAQLSARSSAAVLGRPLPPTSLLGSISCPPVDDSWYFRVTGCKRTADGLSLLLSRRPGTRCLTI